MLRRTATLFGPAGIELSCCKVLPSADLAAVHAVLSTGLDGGRCRLSLPRDTHTSRSAPGKLSRRAHNAGPDFFDPYEGWLRGMALGYKA